MLALYGQINTPRYRNTLQTVHRSRSAKSILDRYHSPRNRIPVFHSSNSHELFVCEHESVSRAAMAHVPVQRSEAGSIRMLAIRSQCEAAVPLPAWPHCAGDSMTAAVPVSLHCIE
ncbi:hypothetical protein DTO032I3_3495 [Paecilomyces variotii]|nr:hypothetical protein DTO032I3_3495 [Paecilomyces variotii]